MARSSGENKSLVANKIKSAASSKGSGHTEEKTQTDSLGITGQKLLRVNRFQMDNLVLVRINPDLLKLMRRIQRFAQVSTGRYTIRVGRIIMSQ